MRCCVLSPGVGMFSDSDTEDLAAFVSDKDTDSDSTDEFSSSDDDDNFIINPSERCNDKCIHKF